MRSSWLWAFRPDRQKSAPETEEGRHVVGSNNKMWTPIRVCSKLTKMPEEEKQHRMSGTIWEIPRDTLKCRREPGYRSITLNY
jgi:hypothetical protein